MVLGKARRRTTLTARYAVMRRGQLQPLRLMFQSEITVDERRGHGSLSDGGCHALYGAVPEVSGDEHAWLA